LKGKNLQGCGERTEQLDESESPFKEIAGHDGLNGLLLQPVNLSLLLLCRLKGTDFSAASSLYMYLKRWVSL